MIEDENLGNEYEQILPGNITVIKTTPDKRNIFIADNVGNLAHVINEMPTATGQGQVHGLKMNGVHKNFMKGSISCVAPCQDNKSLFIGSETGVLKQMFIDKDQYGFFKDYTAYISSTLFLPNLQ